MWIYCSSFWPAMTCPTFDPSRHPTPWHPTGLKSFAVHRNCWWWRSAFDTTFGVFRERKAQEGQLTTSRSGAVVLHYFHGHDPGFPACYKQHKELCAWTFSRQLMHLWCPALGGNSETALCWGELSWPPCDVNCKHGNQRSRTVDCQLTYWTSSSAQIMQKTHEYRVACATWWDNHFQA